MFQTMSILTDNFDELAVATANRQLLPYTTEYQGKPVHFLITHERSNNCYRAATAIRDTFGCQRCGFFTQMASRYTDQNGPIFLTSDVMHHIESDIHKDAYHLAHEEINQSCQQPIDGIYVLNQRNLFDYKSHDSEKGFPHFHINIPEESRTDSSVDAPLIQAAFNRYIYQGQLRRVVDRLLIQGRASCEILERILGDVHYGNTFLPALRWAMKIIDDLGSQSLDRMSTKDQYLFLFKHLLDQKLSKDLYSGAVSFSCQTLAQLVELMECAKSEEAMRKLTEDRLSPLNYQRPTADPSTGNVEEAMRLLGDFSITVAPISAHDAISVGVQKSDEFSALKGFEALKLSADTRKKPETFADRCGGSKAAKIKAITTAEQLIVYCQENPEVCVQIHTSGHYALYYAETTLGKDKLCVPFTWSFQLGESPSKWKIDSLAKVTHIIPGYRKLRRTKWQNILFVVEGAEMSPDTKVNTFPEFLSSEYNRTCGKAYEALKNTMKLSIPTDEPLAFGVGTSASDEHGRLCSNIKLIVDGIDVTISKIE
jgi:hypothetical protein